MQAMQMQQVMANQQQNSSKPPAGNNSSLLLVNANHYNSQAELHMSTVIQE